MTRSAPRSDLLEVLVKQCPARPVPALVFSLLVAASTLSACTADAPRPDRTAADSASAAMPDTGSGDSATTLPPPRPDGTSLADSAGRSDTPPALRPTPAPSRAPVRDTGRRVRPQIDSGRIDRPDVTLPRPGVAAAPEARARTALEGVRDSIGRADRRPDLRARARDVYATTSFSPQVRAEAAGLAGRAYLEDRMNDSARAWVRRAIALDPQPAYAQLLERIPD